MQQLRLSADYSCWPTWIIGEGEFYNVDPKELPISNDLADQLLLWADYYDSFLNRDDPGNSVWMTDEEANEFASRGRELFERLKIELEGKYEVVLGP